jgi:hypothetical protein
MPRAFITSRGQTGVSFGWFGTIVAVLGLIVVVAVIAFAGILVLALVLAGAVLGGLVLGLNRLLLAVSPRRRARRAARLTAGARSEATEAPALD